MKTNLILLALGLMSSFCFSQTLKEKDVPAAVTQAFQKEFPGIKVEKWEKEGANYEVEFDLNKTETSVVYTAAGAFVEKEVEIKPSELPKFVIEYFEKNLPGKKIKEASKSTDADGTITYEAEVEDTEYRFQEAVGLIGQETEKEEGQGDKD
jgi:hypothetical protein